MNRTNVTLDVSLSRDKSETRQILHASWKFIRKVKIASINQADSNHVRSFIGEELMPHRPT